LHDPMHMLLEIQRVLIDGGALVLTTPNIASFASVASLLLLIRLFQQTTRDCGQPSAGLLERSAAPRIRL
jgi:hypothetical protein